MAGRNAGGSERKKKKKKRLNVGCVGGGREISKLFSLHGASLNNPLIILCFCAHRRASDGHALQSGPHQRGESDGGEAAMLAEV